VAEKVAKSVRAPVVATTTEAGTSEKAASRPKRLPMLKERCLLPFIMFPEYMRVDKEVGTYFSRYNHKSYFTNLISWLPINTITDLETYLVTVHTIQLDATPLAEFVFMNRGDEQGLLSHV